MHLLPCPNCQESVLVSTSQAGDSTQCTACDASIDIPKLGDLRQLPRVEQNDPNDPAVAKRSENSAGSQIVSTILGCVAVVMLITAAYCGFRWASIKPKSSTEQHLADVAVEYPKMDPAYLVRQFEDMEAASLDMPTPYNYKVTELAKNREGTKAAISGVIALVAGVMSIVIASTGRTSEE